MDVSLVDLLHGMAHTLTTASEGASADSPPRRRRTVRAKRCDCGWRGVTVQQCETAGAAQHGAADCLYDDTVPHSPFCFFGANSSRARSCVSGGGGGS